MFIQVIQGAVADPAGLLAAEDRWQRDCAAGAFGWLGSTSGITDDGTYIGVERFESADAARHNSARPEQDAWWTETQKCFAGEVTFFDATDVLTWLDGGSDDAGFVQVIEGRMNDPQAMRALMETHSADLRQRRPDIIGGTVALHDDGEYVQTLYFTSEAEARVGEQQPPPPDVAERLAAEMADARFFDLHQPRMFSPR